MPLGLLLELAVAVSNNNRLTVTIYHARWCPCAMPISSCALRLDDEAVRIGVCLWLGWTVCVSHQCHCGASVDALGLHGFVSKKAPGRPARHHALNDLVARAMVSAGIRLQFQRFQTFRQNAARRSFSHPLAGREATHLGRCRYVPSERFVRCHSSPRSRAGS